MLQQNCAAGNPSTTMHSTVPDQGLTKSQERAIAALLESRSIESAARKARVELASLRRWMRDDEGFQSRMSEIRRKAHSDMKKRLREGALEANDDLIDLVTAKKLVPRGKASLIRTLVEFAFRPPRYYADIEERLSAVQNRMRAAGNAAAAASDRSPAI